MKAVLLLAVLAIGCASKNGVSPGTQPDGGGTAPRIPRHETFLRNPTRVDGDEVVVNLPAGYREDLVVEGLSDGWQGSGRRVVWVGSGVCLLELHELGIRARRSMTVTLVSGQAAPEVTVQASGNVSMLHSVRGVGSSVRDAVFLLLHNERSLER